MRKTLCQNNTLPEPASLCQGSTASDGTCNFRLTDHAVNSCRGKNHLKPQKLPGRDSGSRSAALPRGCPPFRVKKAIPALCVSPGYLARAHPVCSWRPFPVGTEQAPPSPPLVFTSVPSSVLDIALWRPRQEDHAC